MKNESLKKNTLEETNFKLVRNIIHVSSLKEFTNTSTELIEVKAHSHNDLFQIFLIKKGYAKLICYNKEFEMNDLSFFTIPKNILHSITLKTDTEGYVISISDLGLEKTLTLDADIFFDIEEVFLSKINLENPLLENFYQTYLKCIKEFNQDLPARELALEYLTGMLLIRLFRIPLVSKNIIKKDFNTYRLLYRRFRNLIKKNYSFKHSVEFYATELSISPSHLNRICNQVVGESTKKIISKFFINEAKILLTKVDYSITDVSYKLGFDDPSYFTRLFKQITKQTPRDFRKSLGL